MPPRAASDTRPPASHDALRAAGLFLRRGWIPREECRALVRVVRKAEDEAAGVVRRGESLVDPHARRTSYALVPPEIEASLRARLEALRPDLARHFGLRLRGMQSPQVLTYRAGDFFHAHRDNSGDPRNPAALLARRVSVVVFLNDHASVARPGARDAFDGGLLTFHRVTPRPTWADFCLPVAPEAGLAVAFRADALHEVTPVARGLRHSVVTWFT